MSLRRGGRDILCEVDWTIRNGERWVVLGPNGSGKTSLVEILSTYLRASTGSVSVLGRELRRTNVHELRPSIGYLSAALLPLVPDGLPVGLEILGRPWSEPMLIKLASGFEAVTKNRRVPASTPPLAGERIEY